MTGVRVASVGFIFTGITEESGGTFAGEAGDAIDTGAAILTGVWIAVIDIGAWRARRGAFPAIFHCARGIATIAGIGVVVVAAFTVLEDAITADAFLTTDTLTGRCVARLAVVTLVFHKGVFVEVRVTNITGNTGFLLPGGVADVTDETAAIQYGVIAGACVDIAGSHLAGDAAGAIRICRACGGGGSVGLVVDHLDTAATEEKEA